MPDTTIQPYLFLGGRCEEAMQFYQQALGAKVEMMMRFSESPQPPQPDTVPDGWEDKIMHASLSVGSNRLNLSDGNERETSFSGFCLYLSAPNETEAKRIFDTLSASGTVTMPLSKTFWSPAFGMLQDQFGIGWTIGVASE